MDGDSTWRRIGDPTWDDYVRSEILKANDVLASNGALVVWLTVPQFGTADADTLPAWQRSSHEPWRVDRLNQILREAVAQRPDTARLVDLGPWMTPHVNDTEMRDDGTHYNWTAENPVVSDFVGPEVLAAWGEWWTGLAELASGRGSPRPGSERPGGDLLEDREAARWNSVGHQRVEVVVGPQSSDHGGLMSDTTITDTAVIDITPAAMETVLGILAEEDDPESLGLRIEITGTKGVDFIYDLSFDELANVVEGDVVSPVGEVQVIVPAGTVDQLRGSVLDIPRAAGQGGLVIRNPNRPDPLAGVELEPRGHAWPRRSPSCSSSRSTRRSPPTAASPRWSASTTRTRCT